VEVAVADIMLVEVPQEQVEVVQTTLVVEVMEVMVLIQVQPLEYLADQE
tara:strand:- start:70 stop:216 length:147 start_codon:yes stop_codon:yes gene_type:complete